MLFVYKYQRALDIIEMLTNNKIVTLDIYLDDSLGEEAAEYVFNYTTIDDYESEEELKEINDRFNDDDSISIMTRAISGLTEFVEMLALENIEYFKYSFDIRISKMYIEKAYLGKVPPEPEPEEEITFAGFMNKFEEFIANTGIHKVKVDMYQKVPNPNGKRPKYEQMNIGQIICMLKEINIDNGKTNNECSED